MANKDMAEIQRLFDNAAAQSVAMICAVDAEPAMRDFVQVAMAAHHMRSEIVRMLQDSLDEGFYMSHAPVELWRYCAHFLGWPELHQIVTKLKSADIERRGAARSNVWDYILQAFDKDWIDSDNYMPF